MRTFKFRNQDGNVRIEINAMDEKEADRIFVHVIKFEQVDKFYSTFE